MLKFSQLLEGNNFFKNSYFKKNEKNFLKLAKEGQHPKALFIGCSDSRVIPNLITQTSPGDMFVIRNVGNFVAPFKPDKDFHSTASAIEYAVEALKVSEIIICGHTQCGAIEALHKGVDKHTFIHTEKWLSLGQKAKELAILDLGKDANKEALLRLTEKLSIVTQIENLLSYPFIKEKLEKGTLNVYGWIYDIHTGSIEYYDPDELVFKRLDELFVNIHKEDNDNV